ncbi:hypothetical protein K1X45_15790 [Pseudochrobactrum sp. Wa41.01b-1]|uniref:hypothetical protein n=1 Tax=Pseudochrobactrum sp. Wa41.01b-1 TaxID=2864102 RepID=UPI001C688A08|nr:hypothetical protein [Pseudochrobactrum sp. Wa41.01b-1]QYM72869.1 hypothetical protein K1X45_15790 [Pseudochrobactrum sp. Wa41.01b-1]
MTRDELINHLALNATQEDIDRHRKWRDNAAGGSRKLTDITIEKARFLYAKAMLDARDDVFSTVSPTAPERGRT